MDGETALKRLEAADVQMLPLDKVHTHEALQPRSLDVLRGSQQADAKQRSAGHVANLRCVLRTSKRAQLEPLLVAQIDGRNYVVDGHHRVRAYRAEKRATIPARVLRMHLTSAALASKLVNLTGRAMAMERAQIIEAAWQTLAAMTDGGHKPLPPGESYVTLEARLGPGHSTLQRMTKRMQRIVPSEWVDSERDPGTGYPMWNVVRNHDWNKGGDAMTYDEVKRRMAERCAAGLVKQLEAFDADVRQLAWEIVVKDHRQLADEAAAFRELEVELCGDDGDSDF